MDITMLQVVAVGQLDHSLRQLKKSFSASNMCCQMLQSLPAVRLFITYGHGKRYKTHNLYSSQDIVKIEVTQGIDAREI
jgi:hypothetical protein